MTSLFNYNTLKVSLLKDTRTLTVSLNRPHKRNAINFEMLFELESLLSWSTSHLEIESILFNSTSPYFSIGMDDEEIALMDEEKLKKYFTKLQKIIFSLYFLPQTIIFDLGSGAQGVGAELSIGGDLRFAKTGAQISFPHLQYGFSPNCGAIGFLGNLVPKSFVRSWILLGSPIDEAELTESGFIKELYYNDEIVDAVLETIHTQAHVQRIQAKKALLDSMLPELERATTYEKLSSFTGFQVEDIQNAAKARLNNTEPEFIAPRDLAIHLKKQENPHLHA